MSLGWARQRAAGLNTYEYTMPRRAGPYRDEATAKGSLLGMDCRERIEVALHARARIEGHLGPGRVVVQGKARLRNDLTQVAL